MSIKTTLDTCPIFGVHYNLANNTVYYWRVDATKSGEGTGAWSSVNSFTTIAGVPALTLPGNGAVGQALSLTMSWGTVAGATSYDLQVSTDVSFGSTVTDQSALAAASGAVSGLGNNTVYYWRVDATKSGEGTGAWSSINSFTTIVGVPTPALPGNGAVGQALSLTMSWGTVAGATSYDLQVSTDAGFGSTVSDQNALAAASGAVSGLGNNTVYYWRVDATKSGEGTGAWSSINSFTTIIGAPAPASPSNDAVGQATTLNLTWNSLAGAASYGVQVSAAMDFSSTIFYGSNISGTSAMIAGLANNDVYYWRVNATESGATGAWSTVYSFTTIVGVPTPALPVSGAVGQATTLTMSWGTVAGATSYDLQVSTDAGFGSTVSDQNALAAASGVVSGLGNNTVYYWRVDATKSGEGTGAWSSVSSFTTIVGVPVLALPANGAVNQPLSLTVNWGTVSGAATYACRFQPVRRLRMLYSARAVLPLRQ